MAKPLGSKEFVLREGKHLDACKAYLDWNWQENALEGCPLVVEIQPEKTKRSIQQNRRYFGGTIAQIAEQAAVDGRKYAKEVWHEHMCRLFIGVEPIPGGGLTGISSTTLDVKEFAEFIEKVEAYAAQELGVSFMAMEY